MQAWLPIMARSNERVQGFVDAFAGPGEYKGGEPGSPLIALRTFMQHRAFDQLNGRILFKFIEKEADRVNHLLSVLKRSKDSCPPTTSILIIPRSMRHYDAFSIR